MRKEDCKATWNTKELLENLPQFVWSILLLNSCTFPVQSQSNHLSLFNILFQLFQNGLWSQMPLASAWLKTGFARWLVTPTSFDNMNSRTTKFITIKGCNGIAACSRTRLHNYAMDAWTLYLKQNKLILYSERIIRKDGKIAMINHSIKLSIQQLIVFK